MLLDKQDFWVSLMSWGCYPISFSTINSNQEISTESNKKNKSILEKVSSLGNSVIFWHIGCKIKKLCSKIVGWISLGPHR